MKAPNVLQVPTAVAIHGIVYPFSVKEVQECGCHCWPCGHGPPVRTFRCNRCGWETSYATCGDGNAIERASRQTYEAVEYHSARCDGKAP